MKITMILEKIKEYAEFSHTYPFGRSESGWLIPAIPEPATVCRMVSELLFDVHLLDQPDDREDGWEKSERNSSMTQHSSNAVQYDGQDKHQAGEELPLRHGTHELSPLAVPPHNDLLKVLFSTALLPQRLSVFQISDNAVNLAYYWLEVKPKQKTSTSAVSYLRSYEFLD